MLMTPCYPQDPSVPSACAAAAITCTRPCLFAAPCSQLLERIRPLNRGAAASEEDKADVDALASQLERMNPNPKPLTGGVVDGAWELQYTTSSTILGLNKPPFLRPTGKILQVLGEGAPRHAGGLRGSHKHRVAQKHGGQPGSWAKRR